MTARDRIVLMAIVVVVLLAGGYVLVVSPERHKATEAQAQVQSARQQLQSAQSQAISARAAERRYTAAYSSVVSLGKAVPPSEEVPSLIYQLELASDQRDVDFNSITTSSSKGSGTAAGGSAADAGASTAAASFAQMPFTFIFKGTFAQLGHLLGQVEDFAQRTNTGGLKVSGRLLTIQSVDITPEGSSSTSSPSVRSANMPLSATITATAYVLPASQGLTGGATAVAPSATSAVSSGSSSASTAATAAVVKATP